MLKLEIFQICQIYSHFHNDEFTTAVFAGKLQHVWKTLHGCFINRNQQAVKTASENLEHSDFFHRFLISNNIVSVHQTFSSKPLNPVDINDYCMFHIESEAKLWADLSHSSVSPLK